MPDATLEKDQIFPKLCGNQSFIGLKGKLLTAFRKRIDKCRLKKTCLSALSIKTDLRDLLRIRVQTSSCLLHKAAHILLWPGQFKASFLKAR